MSAHHTPLEELLKKQNTLPQQGLSQEEAQKRLLEFGENRLAQQKKKSMLARFFMQFKDPMILILLAAAVVSFVVALNGHDPNEFFEPVLILLIVVANAILSLSQESRAEKALEALKDLSAPHARVLRGGEEEKVDALTLVPGDVVLIEAGDFIPADGRILDSASLKCEESALTGESVPSEKDESAKVAEDAPLGDRLNMVYSGCSVSYGRASYVVTATGMNTEMGRIADLLNAEDNGMTPLQQKLAKLSRLLGLMALVICLVIFGMGLWFGMPWIEIFMTAVSLAVSAIPEGLPAIVTIVLAIGVQRMVKKNAIIRRLPAVETLGSASVVCSDKTGTLTQNRMTLTKAFSMEGNVEEEISEENGEAIRKLLAHATLCCDGSVHEDEHGEIQLLGDPTETSIVQAALQNGMPKVDLAELYPRVGEVPFDSDRKRMSVVCKFDGKLRVITKGAFDSLAACCKPFDTENAAAKVDEMSENALRVLAVAYKDIDTMPKTEDSEHLEKDLQFLGLVGMMDPPRPEVRDAVAVCRKAGIRPVMITGDHVVTAGAIAKDLGMLLEGEQSLTGAELSKMSEEELDAQVENISVYARVSPEDKIRIVKAWQKRGEVVSMTGDGVNDAPALKAADIGCAMGITGTDVAKGAADMTLTDDNFTTIVDAVKEGRGIYDNIRKTVGFLLGTNIGEVFTVLCSMMFFRVSPLLSMQLLWINLVTDSLPAIALGREAVDDDVMLAKPRPKDESLFAHQLGAQVLLQGVMFAALTLGAFAVGYVVTPGEGALDVARTMAFLTLAQSQIFHSFNMRSRHSIFRIGVFSNKYLNAAAVLSLSLTLLVAFVPPLATAFSLVPLSPVLYLLVLALSLLPVPVLEISKATGFLRHEKHLRK